MYSLEILKIMNIATVTRLAELNQELYQQQGSHFNDTRMHSWVGWHRCLRALPSTASIRVLDIGCGNGRFGSFLRENLPTECEIEYVGIDGSAELLSAAQARLKDAKRFSTHLLQQNLVQQLLANQPMIAERSSFDLVVLFGLMHHIPSYTLRKQLLAKSAQLLSSTAQLWLSFWLFAEHERFLLKQIDPQQLSIATDQLEPGDYLLPWDTSNSVRYCHYANGTEQQQLVAATRLATMDSFTADGKTNDLNRYFVLQNA